MCDPSPDPLAHVQACVHSRALRGNSRTQQPGKQLAKTTRNHFHGNAGDAKAHQARHHMDAGGAQSARDDRGRPEAQPHAEGHQNDRSDKAQVAQPVCRSRPTAGDDHMSDGAGPGQQGGTQEDRADSRPTTARSSISSLVATFPA